MPFNSESASEAGKKSKRGVSERAKILNDLLKEEKARAVFLKLEAKALDGDMDAIKTYLAYCFGKPVEKHELTGADGEALILNGIRPKENLPILTEELLNGNGQNH